MAGAWENEWKVAKKAFEDKTGQKKPSQKTSLGFKKPSGLEDSLKSCDKDYNAANGEQKDIGKKTAALQRFDADIKAFDVKATAYEKVLIASMEKADEKLVKPELDVLLKQMHAIGATMKAHLKGQTTGLEQMNGTEFLAKTLTTNLTGGIARAKLFAAKVASSKDGTVFNTGIATATRDITQCIGNVEKLRAKGYTFPKGDPGNLFKVLTPWAQGQRMLKLPADEPMVKRELNAYVQAIAGVENWSKG